MFRGELVKVFSIIGQKGGSGKTTLSLSLAVAAQRDGKSVAIIDLDSQASACKWGDRRNADPPVISIQAARLTNYLATAREHGAEFVIIDTPPRAADAAMAAAKAADLILIPCRPEIKEIETLATARQLIASTGTKAPVFVVLNGLPPGGKQARLDAVASVEGEGLVAAPVGLSYRAAYKYADILGQTPQEYEADGKAGEEIEQVYKFACKQINTSTVKQETPHGRQAKSA